MCRVLHVLLVSYALLACPYRCLGSSPVKCSEQARSCSCCERESEAAGSENDQDTPAPDEPCKCNCLCQGAVLSKDDLPLTADSDWPGLVSAVLPAELVAASEGTPRLTRDRQPGSAAASGRTLRFALQSLQI